LATPARVQTGCAAVLFTALASAAALAAAGPSTVMAARRAVEADGAVAMLACGGLVIRRQLAAGITLSAVPALERHVRAARAVGP